MRQHGHGDEQVEGLNARVKYHAPGIGLVRDQDLRLVKHGFVKDK